MQDGSASAKRARSEVTAAVDAPAAFLLALLLPMPDDVAMDTA
jgi:hypothetical protein